MSTVAGIIDAWQTKVFNHDDIRRISQNVLHYEFTEESEKEVSFLMGETEINFFEIIASKAWEYVTIGGGIEQTFNVLIRFTKEKTPDGTNAVEVTDFLDTLIPLVQSELGDTWNSTVDFWTFSTEPFATANIRVAQRDCVRMSYRFIGKQLS